MRLPVNYDISTRDGTLARDSVMQNFSVVPDKTGPQADKRPGTWDDGAFSATGNGNGIFGFGNNVYMFNNSATTPNIVPTTNFDHVLIVANVQTDLTDAQYSVVTLSPKNPFATGATYLSASGFPLVKNYLITY